LKKRIRNEKRWDPDFVEDTLDGRDAVRVWACGPPRMNKMFEKTFKRLVVKGKLGNSAYDVL